VPGNPYPDSELFPAAQEDFLNMAGQFADNGISKDDCSSMASSMNDSAYLSQPDFTQTTTRFISGIQKGAFSGSRKPGIDSTLGLDVYSPTLSSQSLGTFNRSPCGMAPLMLPQTEELAIRSARIPPLDNMSLSELYGSTASLGLQHNSTSQYLGTGIWLGDDAQGLSESFGVSPLNGAPAPFNQQISHATSMSEPFFAAQIGCLDSTLMEDSSNLSQFTAAGQSHMHRMAQGSDPAPAMHLGRPASVNDTCPETHASMTRRRTSSIVTSNLSAGSGSLQSPTTSALSHSHVYAFAEPGYTGAVHAYMDMAGYAASFTEIAMRPSRSIADNGDIGTRMNWTGPPRAPVLVLWLR